MDSWWTPPWTCSLVQMLQGQRHQQLLCLTEELGCSSVLVDGLRQMETQPTADSTGDDDDDGGEGFPQERLIQALKQQTYYLVVHRWRKVSFTSRSTSAALVSGSLTFTWERDKRLFPAAPVHVLQVQE